MVFEIPSWILDNLDWIGFGFIAYGIYSFRKLQTDGFLYASVGSLLLVAWGAYLHHWGTMAWNILFAILYHHSYRNGRKLKNIVEKALDGLKKDTE